MESPASHQTPHDAPFGPLGAPTPPSSAPAAAGEPPVTVAEDHVGNSAASPSPSASASPAPPRGGLKGRLAAGLASLANRLAQPPAAGSATAPTTPAEAPEAGRPKLRRKQEPRYRLRRDAPAWLVSLLVHGAVLGVMGLATLTPEVRRAVAQLNAAMVDTSLSQQQAEELVHILSDPTELSRTFAAADLATTPGLGEGLTATGAPSETPQVAMATRVTERGNMPAPDVIAPLTGLAFKPPSAVLRESIGGGMAGMIAGDVARPVEEVGEALDQLAREILRHLEDYKVTVVWLFDESNSMRDDQQAIKNRFDRVSSQLKLHHDPSDQVKSDALTHVVVGFGEGIHFVQEQPTSDVDRIATAIDRLAIDPSGKEHLCQAVTAVINRYARLISDERRLLLVIATDESGDDGADVERARLAAVRNSVPIYVIGRQAMFGTSLVRLPYKDPVTGDTYWPSINRGPETAGFENLQYDGLHDRWDEQPSGFGPYELARLAKDTGGIYFLLPNEEDLRRKDKRLEKAYSMATLKEYVPAYEHRDAYRERIASSPLRRSLVDNIERTKNFGFRKHYPIEPAALLEAIRVELPKVTVQLNELIALEQRLRALERERDRERDRRWVAAYDLMLAQLVAYQIKAYEYRAMIQSMALKARAGQLQPSKMPIPDKLVVEWDIHHAPDRQAPEEDTAEKRATAEALLKTVIERHPDSPWADLAQMELDRGFGCRLGEWHHNPEYDKRQQYVPKF